MAFLLNEDGSFLLNEDGTKIEIDEDEILADPIDLITANPDTANPTSFATEADLYVTQFKASIPQLNTAFTALRLVSVSDVSNTSNALTEGEKTFTVSSGKSFLPGQFLNIVDAAAPTTNGMLMQIKSYAGNTLVGTCSRVQGTGTITNWVISLSAPPILSTAGSLLHAHTGNGLGSTNNKIRRLATVVSNTGENVDWNYLDSATLGGSITIIKSGIYMINYMDAETSANTGYGISKDSNQLTTAFNSITETHKLLVVTMSIGNFGNGICTYLAPGNVLRMHTDGTNTDISGINRLRMERIL